MAVGLLFACMGCQVSDLSLPWLQDSDLSLPSLAEAQARYQTSSTVEVEVNGEYLVDNGFAVAWEPTLQYRLTRARKIRSFLFGDQILLRFSGHGRLWVQSRSPHSLANFLHPFRPVQQNTSN